MAIEILIQKDYLLTEVTLSPKATPEEVDELMRALKTNSIVTLKYNGGNYPGVHIEQKTKIGPHLVEKVRSLLGIGDREA